MSSPRDRRLRAVTAGHHNDEETARNLLDDADAHVRAAALGALDRMGRLDMITSRDALDDPDSLVRCRAVHAAIAHPEIDLTPVLDDPDAQVVEAAAFAIGERDHDPSPITTLRRVALEHDDELCRESAVAALGALGSHDEADHAVVIDTLLRALDERPPIRRRAIIGLHQFDQPAAVAAVKGALEDRDRQVRALAGELLGVPVD
ncbi:MAG: HEAT repeat domain-containing protein [Actinomycetota bacterium]|jgi:HEAT repeat protein|nr:HEAT repeat domain-containing protein [Actinomycetota bacterium]